MSLVSVTVGVPPCTVTAPLFTRMFPATSREITMVLSCALPVTVTTPLREGGAVAAVAEVSSSRPTLPPIVLATARSGPSIAVEVTGRHTERVAAGLEVVGRCREGPIAFAREHLQQAPVG